MPMFRKKPVVVEAHQWFKNGDHPRDYDTIDFVVPGGLTTEERKAADFEGEIVRRYCHPNVPGDMVCKHCGNAMHIHGWIDTLEGGHIVCPGDWVITGVKGENYPCKPDVFAATYEAVESPATTADPTAPRCTSCRGSGIRTDHGRYGYPCLRCHGFGAEPAPEGSKT